MNDCFLQPEQPIRGLPDATIGDFWVWAYSDLVSNTVRPIFAEFLVGRCLGVLNCPRKEWDHVDLCYGGKKIEVKSSAYVQTWAQTRPSTIVFDISSKRSPWIAELNQYGLPGRSADCYVFCLHTDMQRACQSVADVSHWEFFVLSAETINRHFGMQKRVRLSRLKTFCSPVTYGQLKQMVDAVLAG